MNLEVKYGDTAYVFSFTKIDKNQAANISTATIQLTDRTGTEVLAETAMIIAANVATYTWDSSDQEIDCNYIANMVIDGVCHNRFFDIYYYPFQNTVTDDDLFNEDEKLRLDENSFSGKADSGTVTTLIDNNLADFDNDYFNGGLIEIFYDGKSEIRTVTDYDSATYKLTFDPAVDTVVTDGLGYCVRKSYQDLIDLAGEQIQERFQQMEKRAYLLIDHTQLKRPIIYKALELHYKNKRKELEDEYDLKMRYYQDNLQVYMETTLWKYDTNSSGELDTTEEEAVTSRVKWHS
jgi:hypothetical protein